MDERSSDLSFTTFPANKIVTENEDEAIARPGFRFSLNAVILWIAILALIFTNVLTYNAVLDLKNELRTSAVSGMPIPAEEVAKQFIKATNIPSTVTTEVEDVRYSSEEDTYLVEFAWTLTATGKKWYSSTRLKSDGFGFYHGQILSSQFNQPLGRTRPYSVSVHTPSPLKGKP